MADIPLNVVIFMAFKPLLKIYLSAGLGFMSVKQGILTREATHAISQMILKFFLPCLVFSNVVSNIKVSDAKYFGILLVTSSMYFALGALFAFFLRLTVPIPRGWIGGITYASILNNSSDLPIAYVQTLGKSKYFPDNSTSLGTAYCVLYSLGFNLFVYNFGGARILKWDADVPGPNKFEPTTPPLSLATLFHKIKHKISGLKGTGSNSSSVTSELPTINVHPKGDRESFDEPTIGIYNSQIHAARSNEFTDDQDHQIEDVRVSTDVVSIRQRSHSFGSAHETKSELGHPVDSIEQPSAWGRFKTRAHDRWVHFKEMNTVTLFVATFIEGLYRIQAIAIMVSILVAFVPWLRRLFVYDAGVHGISDAPDGRPPLDFVMDFVSFIGQCQVQLGLFMLGGNVARLKIKTLPKGFWQPMLGLAIYKLCLLPIFAIFWASRIRKLGWYDDDMPMFPVTMVACSGTPSATSQIYLTLMFTLDSEDAMQQLNCFGATIIANYALLPITITTAMSYTVKNLL